ncbi:MAG: 2-C-methyl-D-erythritol 4-phosphate cytidylyltransferase [Methylophilaceae bacterium]
MQKFHVIIPAAGVGNRMANVLPKQYLQLDGKPMISHVIQVFFNNPRIVSIHLALSPLDDFWRTLTLNPESKLHLHYTGGESRSDTVLNTLQAVDVEDQDWILVHDAARPGLSATLLEHLLDSLENDEVGGLLAMPVADTLKKSDEKNRVETTVSRQSLWQAQTPQMFRYATLKKALSEFDGSATDEAEAIEALGLLPKLVQGELSNLKVTYPQDLAVLEALFEKNIVKQKEQA